ncbi:hypothetical protein WG901_23450 [Novosphingobium sp. PS1R-30]|uniref:Uncharacterized protein n=1 Tax=Novosphingobium anseongense TaxID=3133436 RepID=A0ABU8S326_9SPHN
MTNSPRGSVRIESSEAYSERSPTLPPFKRFSKLLESGHPFIFDAVVRKWPKRSDS